MQVPDFAVTSYRPAQLNEPRWPQHFRVFKRTCDIYFGIVAAPLVVAIGLLLLLLNPFLNPGPLLFRQERMGRGGVPFVIWKFRTMVPDEESSDRTHDEGVEVHRITRLGSVLRKYRIDELPNFFNVLKGDMSVIGPRPDMIDHALVYAGTIPRYRERFAVRPGITGLAQVRQGYADQEDAVRRKARNDWIYIERGSVSLDLRIMVWTVAVMVTGFGAR